MFTTVQKFRSYVTCKDAAEEFQILVNTWQHSSAFTRKVFFAMVDYDKNPEAFQTFQLISVSSSLHFSAKRKFRWDDIYHLEERGLITEQMAKWVAENWAKEGQHQNQIVYELSRSLQVGDFLVVSVDVCIYWNRIGNLFLTTICGQF